MAATVLLLAVITGGCTHALCAPKKAEQMPGKPIEQVQQQYTDAWMAIPGVVGTAIGLHDGKPCIMVLTAADSEQIRERIPPTVEGYPIVVQYTGEIRALDEQ